MGDTCNQILNLLYLFLSFFFSFLLSVLLLVFLLYLFKRILEISWEPFYLLSIILSFFYSIILLIFFSELTFYLLFSLVYSIAFILSLIINFGIFDVFFCFTHSLIPFYYLCFGYPTLEAFLVYMVVFHYSPFWRAHWKLYEHEMNFWRMGSTHCCSGWTISYERP